MSTLSLQNVRSYPAIAPVSIDLSSYVTLIYGQNGAGKSTISGFFYREGAEEYHHCSITPRPDMQYMVFSQEYVDDMFSRPYQPGVFSLSDENLPLRREIDGLEATYGMLRDRLAGCAVELEKNAGDVKKVKDECVAAINGVAAEIRSRRALWDLMSGNKQPERLYDLILSHTLTEEVSTEDLHKELLHLEAAQAVAVSELPALMTYPLSLDDRLFLSESAEASRESPLSDWITQLNNLSWVQLGTQWLHSDCCPFCQGQVDTEVLKQSIAALFDQRWSDAVLRSEKIATSYQRWLYGLTAMQEELNACSLAADQPALREDTDRLIRLASENLQRITDKSNDLVRNINLHDEKAAVEAVERGLSQLNEHIREQNRKSADYRQEKARLSMRLRSHIRALAAEFIQKHNDSLLRLEQSRNPHTSESQRLSEEMTALREIIREKSGQIAGTEQAVQRINDDLQMLGISGFCIESYHGLPDQYCLIRQDKPTVEPVFSKLSEGEKNIIAFLYFLETCMGRSTRDDDGHSQKLIVIDDPVSSLSQNYIFEIAGMIQQRLIAPRIAGKIVILTHNLFFFQEMLLCSGKNNAASHPVDWKLLRVVKDEFSGVQPVIAKALMNDYQALWYVLKTSKDHDAANVIIPNTMRQILEYYFSFSGKNDRLYKALETLINDRNEPGMRAFARYINRHSHADARNIRQLETADVGRYLRWFSRVFEEAQDREHYDRMMEGRQG